MFGQRKIISTIKAVVSSAVTGATSLGRGRRTLPLVFTVVSPDEFVIAYPASQSTREFHYCSKEEVIPFIKELVDGQGITDIRVARISLTELPLEIHPGTQVHLTLEQEDSSLEPPLPSDASTKREQETRTGCSYTLIELAVVAIIITILIITALSTFRALK